MGSRQGRLAAQAPFRAHKFGLVKETCRDGGVGRDEGDQVTKAHHASMASPEAWGTQKALGPGVSWGGGGAEAKRATSNEAPPGPPTPGHPVFEAALKGRGPGKISLLFPL